MSIPPPPVMAAALGPINPIEAVINSLNTNTYLIGMSMILLNLGGRHLALGLTPEQDKFFQNPWIRRSMLFVVIFVATRNVFTALWLSIGLILFIGYLFNEHSDLYIFGEPVPLPPAPPPTAPTAGLTTEEQEIYKRLHDKSIKAKAAEELKKVEAKESIHDTLMRAYRENMASLRRAIGA